jgi:hypothetical protein
MVDNKESVYEFEKTVWVHICQPFSSLAFTGGCPADVPGGSCKGLCGTAENTD